MAECFKVEDDIITSMSVEHQFTTWLMTFVNVDNMETLCM